MSYSPSQPSPAPPLSRASMVIGLYGAMALVALVIAAGRGDPDLYRFASGTHWALLTGPAVGVAAGLAFVGMARVATRHFAWARYLHVGFHDLLGPLTRREIVILALGSSIGEELLFRGALMPGVGLWLGARFGWLAVWPTSRGAPIPAHFTINFLNLRLIVTEPAVLLRGSRP